MPAAVIGTRERLINAAQEELIHGHGHFEMQAVARRARASIGLAYHHFGSKAGLIAAVVEAFYQRLDAAAFTGARLPSTSWADREKARIASYVNFHYAHPLAFFIIGAPGHSLEVRTVEAVFMGRQLVEGALMIEAAQRDKIVAIDIDPHLTIALMIGGIRQALIGALTSERRPDPEQLTNEIWAFMVGALRLTAKSGADFSNDQRPT